MAINLVPPKIKNQKKLEIIFNQIYFGLFIMLIMVALLGFALYTYDTYLVSDLKHSEDNISNIDAKIKSLKDTENLIKDVNSRLGKVNSAKEARTIWSNILTSISNSTPKNVQVRNLSLNDVSSSVNLQGTAETRTDIALYKEKLESVDFKNVTFSTSTYNELQNNYNFSLSFELK